MQFSPAKRYVFVQLRGTNGADCLAGHVDGRAARHQLAEDGGMVEEGKPISKKRKRWAPARDHAIVDIINKTLGQSSTQLSGAAPWPATNQTLYQSLAQPSATAASPQTASPDMDSLLQAEIAREESTGLLGYVHDMEKKQKRHHNITASPEMSNDRLPRSNEHSGGKSLVQAYSHMLTRRVASTPLATGPTPPRPLQDPYIQFKHPETLTAGRGAAHEEDEGQPVPLIDTLPKSKQRQIFGLISGIQGGIDHLQKQLNLLQSALGIEIEDSKVERSI